VQTKLQNIINLLENIYTNLDMIEDTESDGEEHFNDAILQLLENMKRDVTSLDDKEDARQATGIVPKEDKNDWLKNIDRADSQGVKEQRKYVQQIKQEGIVVKQELTLNSTKATTMYLCPMDDCNFSTTKEGMKSSKAASTWSLCTRLGPRIWSLECTNLAKSNVNFKTWTVSS
jgi:hypothetical protein